MHSTILINTRKFFVNRCFLGGIVTSDQGRALPVSHGPQCFVLTSAELTCKPQPVLQGGFLLEFLYGSLHQPTPNMKVYRSPPQLCGNPTLLLAEHDMQARHSTHSWVKINQWIFKNTSLQKLKSAFHDSCVNMWDHILISCVCSSPHVHLRKDKKNTNDQIYSEMFDRGFNSWWGWRGCGVYWFSFDAFKIFLRLCTDAQKLFPLHLFI